MKKTKGKHPQARRGEKAEEEAIGLGNRHVCGADAAIDTYRAAWESAREREERVRAELGADRSVATDAAARLLREELARWVLAHGDAASAHATAAAELRRVQAEREELAELVRRAIGVISDVDRTRGEAAAVLDRYAELWPIGGRL